MDLRTLVLFTVAVLAAFLQRAVYAEFYYNRVYPEPDEPKSQDLKCVPGRTVIRVEDISRTADDDDASDVEYTRRTHMNSGIKEEHCKICTCFLDGKDQFCMGRPARTVNECLRMSRIKEEFSKNIPYEHTRDLAYRIRRDYIWHKDEIPYDPRAKCKRGHSYYTNNVNANDTDIDVASDIESLLDYANKRVCFYCVCDVRGAEVGCISRDVWFCEYNRYLREPSAPRDMYTKLLQQDRPTYFRQLSWRLRRTMDSGIYDFVETGGDTLCCNHPDGHRRHLHNSVRNKVRLMRRKVPKENLVSGSPGGDYADFIVNND